MSYEYWDKVYSTKDIKYANYDGWLNKYQSIWENSDNTIDLGCGCGVNSIFLNTYDINTVMCDFSKTALTLVKSAIPKAKTLCFDMTKGLPFEDGFSDLVIADLSLHYFSKSKTLDILGDIHRVLTKKGYLLCRVNSVKDFEKNENEQENTEIEHHLYESWKGYKRFFDGGDVNEFFSSWQLNYFVETETNKYGFTKYTWEICANKRGTVNA